MPNEAVQSLFQRHRNCEGVVQNQFSPQVIAYKVWMKFLSAAIGVLISVIKDGSSGPKPKHRKNAKQCGEKFAALLLFFELQI